MLEAALFGILTLYALLTYRWHIRHPEVLWDWSKIDTTKLSFPKGFVWGSATAAHQVEGNNDNNNWARWENEPDPKSGKSRIQNGDKSGLAADHYNRYREDIQRMQTDLGISSYRFSIEWSRIEPKLGEFDEQAIQHYHDVIDALLEANMTPMITLHHFTHPLWFEDMGSFEKEENLEYFFRFSEKMFEAYGEKVPYWCTHNEPGPFATMGWGLGVFPPGVKSIKRMANVIHNLMRSHVGVYQRIKAMPGGENVQIGLVKNIFQFDPYRRWNIFHWIMCRLFDHTYNESIIRFLRDGIFKLHLPGFVKIYQEYPEAKGATDFIGLNYYSNLLLSPLAKREPPFKPLHRPGQPLTDMPYASYPEGFYRALKRISSIGRPIIITENGIADSKDDRREEFIQRYIYAMSQAIADGIDIKGYYYWSLMDNFEWAEGNEMRFGLYQIDYDSQERTLREGSKAFANIVKQHANS